MARLSVDLPFLHVRYDGRSQDVPLNEIDVRPQVSDAAIKAAVAKHLNVAPEKLRDYVVDRHPTGNVTVRPEAVYG